MKWFNLWIAVFTFQKRGSPTHIGSVLVCFPYLMYLDGSEKKSKWTRKFWWVKVVMNSLRSKINIPVPHFFLWLFFVGGGCIFLSAGFSKITCYVFWKTSQAERAPEISHRNQKTRTVFFRAANHFMLPGGHWFKPNWKEQKFQRSKFSWVLVIILQKKKQGSPHDIWWILGNTDLQYRERARLQPWFLQ